MGVPGWPEFAACTPSIDSVRIVLMQVRSMFFLRLVVRKSRYTHLTSFPAWHSQAINHGRQGEQVLAAGGFVGSTRAFLLP